MIKIGNVSRFDIIFSDSNCNGGRGFYCGDSKCVTLSEYCDGVVNCETENDEKNCGPKSCIDWWNAGHRNHTFDRISMLFTN